MSICQPSATFGTRLEGESVGRFSYSCQDEADSISLGYDLRAYGTREDQLLQLWKCIPPKAI